MDDFRTLERDGKQLLGLGRQDKDLHAAIRRFRGTLDGGATATEHLLASTRATLAAAAWLGIA